MRKVDRCSALPKPASYRDQAGLGTGRSNSLCSLPLIERGTFQDFEMLPRSRGIEQGWHEQTNMRPAKDSKETISIAMRLFYRPDPATESLPVALNQALSCRSYPFAGADLAGKVCSDVGSDRSATRSKVDLDTFSGMVVLQECIGFFSATSSCVRRAAATRTDC